MDTRLISEIKSETPIETSEIIHNRSIVLNAKRYHYVNTLGDRGRCNVSLYQSEEINPERIAVKQLLQPQKNIQTALLNYRNEIEFYKICYPAISTNVYSYTQHETNGMMGFTSTLPYLAGKTLGEFVQTIKHQRLFLFILFEIFLTLDRNVHQRGIQHGDIKHDNLLIVDNNQEGLNCDTLTVNFIDFELSYRFALLDDEIEYYTATTTEYPAPHWAPKRSLCHPEEIVIADRTDDYHSLIYMFKEDLKLPAHLSLPDLKNTIQESYKMKSLQPVIQRCEQLLGYILPSTILTLSIDSRSLNEEKISGSENEETLIIKNMTYRYQKSIISSQPYNIKLFINQNETLICKSLLRWTRSKDDDSLIRSNNEVVAIKEIYPELYSFFKVKEEQSKYNFISILPGFTNCLTLEEYIQTKQSPDEMIATLIAIILELQRIHEKLGIIHGNLGVDVIHIEQTNKKIFFSDFSYAYRKNSKCAITTENKCSRFAPERQNVKMSGCVKADVRSDYYSLGLILEKVQASLDPMQSVTTISLFKSRALAHKINERPTTLDPLLAGLSSNARK